MANPVTIPEDSPFFRQVQRQNELLRQGRSTSEEGASQAETEETQPAQQSALRQPVNSMVSGIKRMVGLLTGIEETDRNLLQQVQSGIPRAIEESSGMDENTVNRLQTAEISTTERLTENLRQQQSGDSQSGESQSVELKNATPTDASLGEFIMGGFSSLGQKFQTGFSSLSGIISGQTSVLQGLKDGGVGFMELIMPAIPAIVSGLGTLVATLGWLSPGAFATAFQIGWTGSGAASALSGVGSAIAGVASTLSSIFSILTGPIGLIAMAAASITNIADWFTGGAFTSQTKSAIQNVPILGTIFNLLTGIPLIGGILEDVILPFAKLGMEAWQLFTNPEQFGKDLAGGLQFLFTEGVSKLVTDLPPLLWSIGGSVLSSIFDFGSLVGTILGKLASLPFDIAEGVLRGLGELPGVGPVFTGLANLIGPLGDFIESPFSSIGSALSPIVPSASDLASMVPSVSDFASIIPSVSDITSSIVSGFNFLRDLRAQFINFMTKIPTLIPQAILSGLSSLAGMFGLTGIKNTLNSISSGIESVRSTVASFLTNPISFIIDGLMGFWNTIKGSIPFVGGEEGGGETRNNVKDATGSEGLAEATEAVTQTGSGLGNLATGNITKGASQVAMGAGTGMAETIGGFATDVFLAEGGVIREPVSGVTASGRKVQIAEAGPEAVVPLPDNGQGEVEPGGGPLGTVLSDVVGGVGSFVEESGGFLGDLATGDLSSALGTAGDFASEGLAGALGMAGDTVGMEAPGAEQIQSSVSGAVSSVTSSVSSLLGAEAEPARQAQPEPPQVQTDRQAPVNVDAGGQTPDTRPELQEQTDRLDQMVALLQQMANGGGEQTPRTNLKDTQAFEMDSKSRQVAQGAF